MLQRPTHFPRTFRNLLLTAPIASLAFMPAGCGRSDANREVITDEPPAFTIRIDRNSDPHARSIEANEELKRQAVPRSLAFRVVGAAPKPEGDAHAEERIAATQAAIIDAFGKALIEARQTRGQTIENFTARLGPRMTVTHLAEGASAELRINLIYRGIENTLVVRDGVLQHPPVDLRLIRRLFDETNGEFSLLATDTTSNDDLVTATVACYLPAGFDPTAKVNIARSDDDTQ